MSFAWVPMTWLRSTAVWALASSTIAWTSARGATPRFLATRVAPPAQVDVAALDHQLQDRVAGPGVDALGDEDVAAHQVGDAVGVADDHRVDGRVLQRVGDGEDRALPGHAGGVADRVQADVGALVDDDDLDLDALLAQALGLGLDPRRLVEERQAGGGSRPRRARACSRARRRSRRP